MYSYYEYFVGTWLHRKFDETKKQPRTPTTQKKYTIDEKIEENRKAKLNMNILNRS